MRAVGILAASQAVSGAPLLPELFAVRTLKGAQAIVGRSPRKMRRRDRDAGDRCPQGAGDDDPDPLSHRGRGGGR